MLRRLSGRTHEVYTGLCIRCGGKTLCGFEETMVRFKALEPSEIESYAKTDEPMDKAGAYGIQGKAAVFVEGINGDFYNVMGLPLCRLDGMLKQMGVRLIIFQVQELLQSRNHIFYRHRDACQSSSF